MSDRVLVDVESGVADVRLNRPEKRNALDIDTFVALAETARHLGADLSVRAIVLSGAGKAFSSGIDTALFTQGSKSDVSLFDHVDDEVPNRAQAVVHRWMTIPQPVIAAIHGTAFGAGFQLALGADVRIGGADTKMSVMEIKWGLVPDMCGTQLLPRIVGNDVAKELTWTGRVIDADEAERLGLVTRLADDPHAEARELARSIANRNPDAVRGAKRLIDHAYDGNLDDGLRLEEKTQREILMTPNQIEAVMAEVEKRAPEFTDPAT